MGLLQFAKAAEGGSGGKPEGGEDTQGAQAAHARTGRGACGESRGLVDGFNGGWGAEGRSGRMKRTEGAGRDGGGVGDFWNV